MLGFANVFGDVVLTAEVVLAGAGLVEVPEDVGGDGVEAHGARLLKAIAPVGTGHARVVHFAGEDLIGMSVELELAGGNAEGVRCGRSLRISEGRGGEKQGQN